jgi:hypothetical protein
VEAEKDGLGMGSGRGSERIKAARVKDLLQGSAGVCLGFRGGSEKIWPAPFVRQGFNLQRASPD